MKTIARQWPYWVIAFLLITNLATIGSIVFHQYRMWQMWQSDKPRNFREFHKQHPKHETALDKLFRKRMNLDEQQAERFRTYRQGYNQRAFELMDSIRTNRNEFLDILAQEPLDSVRLAANAQQSGLLHQQMKLQTIQLYQKLKAECRPDQIEGLNKVFRKLVNNEHVHKARFRQRRGADGPPPPPDPNE